MMVKWVIFSFFGFNVCTQFLMAQLIQPKCTNPQEVTDFFENPTYFSLYSIHENLPHANKTKAVNTIPSFTVSGSAEHQISLKNDTTFMTQEPPVICDEPVRAIFHVTLLSLDSIDESDMVIRKFIF